MAMGHDGAAVGRTTLQTGTDPGLQTLKSPPPGHGRDGTPGSRGIVQSTFVQMETCTDCADCTSSKFLQPGQELTCGPCT